MLGAISIGVAAAAAASYAGLCTMWPTSQLYGANVSGEPRPSKRLALTYDDGPNDPHTGHLLEVLERHGVKATFFMIGKFVEQRPRLASEVCAAGHVVANHTYSHPNLIFVRERELRSQLERTQSAIMEHACEKPTLFRPPFGGRNPRTFGIARDLGLTPVMWRVTCYDWSAKSADSIVTKAKSQIKGGDIILLHDGGHLAMGTDRSYTVKATDEILRRYKGEGYQFVTVPQMMVSSTAKS
jgi:peptidoglycan/xylan/chitin deacetylase (PgdA/CDA1 family)